MPAADPQLSPQERSCALCGNGLSAPLTVREMMFGTGDPFEYRTCLRCGCLQLINSPTNWSRYYPAAYYAFSLPPERRGLRGMLRRLRNQGTFRNEGLLGRLLARRMGYPHAGAERWLATATIGLEASILDVGCGDGMIARDLKEAGYRAVTGIDPFIPESFDFPNGARILRASVSDVPGVYDLIMMHHSLEHVPDQQSTMRAIRERLKPGGWCLIRIPTVSSFAFEHYGAEWVQLDAPRHLFLHSRTSIVELGERAGLTHVATHDDSTIMQFTGSERYRRGLSFSNEAGGFTQAEVQNYRRQTDQLNAAHQGDQIAVYFRNI